MKPTETSLTTIFNQICKQNSISPLIKLNKKQRTSSQYKPLNALEQLNEKNDSLITEFRSPISKLTQFRLPGATTLTLNHWKAISTALLQAINLTEIHISNSIILDFRSLSASLSHLPNLQNCELFSCQLTDSDANCISGFLTNINSLKISDNQITNLTSVITASSNLKTLHIGGNPIVGLDKLLDILAVKNQLISLGLRNLKFTEPDAIALDNLLVNSQIQDLQLRKNSLGDLIFHFTKNLNQNENLRVLELQNAGLTAQSVEILRNNLSFNVSLHALNLAQNQLKDDSADAIASIILSCRNLTTINLDDTKISNLGIIKIIINIQQRNISLTGISLLKNYISDSGLLALGQIAASGQLTSLNLSNNAFSTAGFCQFCELLRAGQTRIRHLDVSGNEVGDSGGLALGGLISVNKSLQRLFLTDCGVKETGMGAIFAGLESNQHVVQMQYGGQGENGNQVSKSLKVKIDAKVRKNAEKAVKCEEIEVKMDPRCKSVDEIDLMLDFHPVDSVGSQLGDYGRVNSLGFGLDSGFRAESRHEFSFFTDQTSRVDSMSDFGGVGGARKFRLE